MLSLRLSRKPRPAAEDSEPSHGSAEHHSSLCLICRRVGGGGPSRKGGRKQNICRRVAPQALEKARIGRENPRRSKAFQASSGEEIRGFGARPGESAINPRQSKRLGSQALRDSGPEPPPLRSRGRAPSSRPRKECDGLREAAAPSLR